MGHKVNEASECTDVNECTEGNNTCDNVSETCVNTGGGYECECKAGFTGVFQGNGTVTCVDDNECEAMNNTCDENAACTNTPGSYTCTCNEGFSGQGITCDDVPECSDPDNRCSENAACVEEIGSYTCTCSKGYTGDGENCTDINECERPEYPVCGTNSTCTNEVIGEVIEGRNETSPGYSCQCQNMTFSPTEDDKNCQPIRTCAEENHECGANTVCVDTFNSEGTKCECLAGYEPVDDPVTECSDVNECVDEALNNCNGTNMNCENAPEGAYTCGCEDGYIVKGFPEICCTCLRKSIVAPLKINIFEQCGSFGF